MRTTPGCKKHQSVSLLVGCRGQCEAAGGHARVTKRTPPVEGNSYCRCYKALWSHEASDFARAPELCRSASREHWKKTGCFCSITDAPNLLSSLVTSPGRDFFQVSLHKQLCKLLMESTSLVVYRRENWEAGIWNLLVSQVIVTELGLDPELWIGWKFLHN